MNLKKVKNVIFTFFLSLFTVCLINSGIVKASALPAKYNMDLDFNANTKTVTGSEEVNIKNSTSTDLKNIVFHLYPDSYNKKETMPSQVGISSTQNLTEAQKGDISISKVLVNDKQVNFTQDNQVLKLSLDNNFKSNEDMKVYIEFKLKLPMSTSRLGYIDNDVSLTNWYPILSMYNEKENKWDENTFNVVGESNYSDVGDYTVNLKVPKNYVVASTGKEAEKSSEKDTKVMNLNASNVRDFIIIMSPNYKVLSKEIDGIKVNSYYISKPGEDDSATAQNVLDSAVGAVKFFSQQFGKYPYDELDLMETHLSGGAMEYPQIIQMPMYAQRIQNSTSASRDDDVSYEDSFISEAAVHEVGHQWWYVTVGNDEFKEPFLDESFTAFSTAYYFEKTSGEYSSNSIIPMIGSYNGANIARIASLYKFPSIASGVDKFDNDSTGAGYNLVIYGKGALLMQDLRKRVGDAAFLNIMQTYFKEYKFKNASIDDFLGVIEKVSGKSVSDAIRASLNSDNYTADNLKLTDDQIQKMADQQKKDRLKNLEKNKGLILGSILLRQLNGEKTILVTPSNLTDDEKKSIDAITKNKIFDSSNISLKQDKDLTDNDISNNNIVLLGNPWKNKAFDSMKNSLPVTINKDGISSSAFSFKGENINGAFTVKNPKNANKLIFVLFWTKDNSIYTDLDWYTGSQFTISIDNKQFFKGSF
ncbi:aminopeptidase [Clostridium carboxidivorans P7]|uniref:Peptidase M1 membrane alanine aminopeptidase n=1 Tax=Clostridium carboxidivorans P7 TaxID=536227 RepID=C6PUM5_9CLOT|nr:M1 family metallopeptidase [Clostridium carboxidivorans]AKN30187.1 aminopeptidase [Clostridium carboxidivorans P7]EET87046.1 Peptidase M1 membrane alanine aminopeptidase [Clostridium carboxidivorans P7]